MAETYHSLTDEIKLCDNLIAAMPNSFYNGIMAVRGCLCGLDNADVLEIVRCKDCRCGKESVDLFGNPAIECEVNGETQPLYWYCAGGEPKEQNNDTQDAD